MKEEDIFGMHLIRWISIFVAACILLFSFATNDDMNTYYQKQYTDITFNNGRTVADDGCGLCSLCYIFAKSTGYELDIQELMDIYNQTYPYQKQYGMSSDFVNIFCQVYDFECVCIQQSKIDKYLNDDYLILALYKDDDYESNHYITLYNIKNNYYIINDTMQRQKLTQKISKKELKPIKVWAIKGR